MARTVGIGNQDFETIRREGYFYIDKTGFIREWWESGDSVALIALNFTKVKETSYQGVRKRICRIIADLNNLKVVTTTSESYAVCFWR